MPVLVFALGVTTAQAQSPAYQTEFPALEYGVAAPGDAFSEFLERLRSGSVTLAHTGDARGYLPSLLEALDIDPSSQILVFSKTSLKQRFISPELPRALYFNDEIYVGYVPGSRSLEVGAMAPVQGPVFFDFSQDPDAEEVASQETSRCLRCHDSYSMTGGGVPRFMLSSVLAGATGDIVSHEISEITTTETPIPRRWGGLFVTGTHGDMPHMGNLIVKDSASLEAIDTTALGNRKTLDEFTTLADYPVPTSDIVALLVLEHQMEVQNRLTRLSFESRNRLARGDTLDEAALEELTTPVVESLFMVHEAPLTAQVSGTSGYAQWFQGRGPKTADGRSLRQLDLETRTFRYPLSYVIYSPAIDALPEEVRQHLFARIRAVLAGDVDYPHLNQDLRAGITAILRETRPEILQ